MNWEDNQYLEEMEKLVDNKNLSIEKKCDILEIKKWKYYRLKKELDNPSARIHRDDQKYLRIENYRDFELYRGIIIEAITRIHNSEEVFHTRTLCGKELIEKDGQPSIYMQEIKDAIAYDRKIINDEIKKISNITINNYSDKILNKYLLKNLKNNAWVIGYIKQLIDDENTLITNILNRKHAKYNDLGFMVYEGEYKTDFIDILIRTINTRFPFDEKSEKKNTMTSRFTKKNGELVKHYLLKYIQKPRLNYSIKYSNTLLDQYNFQKVSLEIDMTIPEENQKTIVLEEIKELYSKNIPFIYMEFIDRTLVKFVEDLEFKKINKEGWQKRYSSLSEKVADMFCIYDVKKNNRSDSYCAKMLLDFYWKKDIEKYDISERMVKKLFKIISNFMEEFEKKYKIQPSLLSKEKADYKEQIRKSSESTS